jgi:uncharacterized cupin superfamily protein
VYRFLATGEDTNGKYALWEAILPPGGGPPSHVHSRDEEGFHVLEGEITFTELHSAGSIKNGGTSWVVLANEHTAEKGRIKSKETVQLV